MWTKFGLKLQKNFEMWTSGGGGGWSVISDTPGRGGRGGQKRANFCGLPLWMAPKLSRNRKLSNFHVQSIGPSVCTILGLFKAG